MKSCTSAAMESFFIPSASRLTIQSSPGPYLYQFLSPLKQFSNFKDIKSTKYSEKKGILNTTSSFSTGGFALSLFYNKL